MKSDPLERMVEGLGRANVTLDPRRPAPLSWHGSARARTNEVTGSQERRDEVFADKAGGPEHECLHSARWSDERTRGRCLRGQT